MPTCPTCQTGYAQGSRFCPSCGASAVATGGFATDPWIGQVVNGKFRVESMLGQGGMGRVYRATHLTLERPVVLKMLHRGLTSDPAVAQRFHREAKAASRLVHPHSIQVLDFGEAEDGTLFMAMEYLAGKDLSRVIEKSGPLPLPRIVRIGGQILEALGEAHAHGIIHRDLKPENVMVEDRRNEPDHVTVLDFGIAKISDPGPGETALTQAGLVCGTPQYMSPEQARGLPLDPRTDLYSMGVLLYQMATGLLPFDSDTPVGFLGKHIAERPLPLGQRAPGVVVAPALEALILRTLAKDPDDRPASADAMRAELLACLPRETARTPAARAPAAKGPSAREADQAEAARQALPVVPIAALVILALVGVGAWAVMRNRSAPAPAPVAAATPTAAPTPAPTPTPTPTATPTATPPAAAPPPDPEPAARPARDPARAQRLFARAEEKRKGMETAAAIRLYQEAGEADPELAEVHKKLGQCYQLQGDIPRARESYRRYLASHPPDADRIRASLDMLR